MPNAACAMSRRRGHGRRRIVAVGFIAIAIAIPFDAASANTTSLALFPPSTSLSYVATPALSLPAYRTPMVDPQWGTQITRISDANTMGGATVLRHAYSKMQPWNADGTRLVLSWKKPSPMLDGQTYAFIRMADIPSDFRWSSVDPNTMYGYNGGTGQFVRMNATTDARTVIHTFPGTISIGGGEGNASDDDRYWPIQSGGTVYIYDLVTDTVVGQRTFSPAPDNVTLSPSGAYVVLNFEFLAGDPNGGGVQVWDRGLSSMQRRLVSYGVHGDVCRDTAGNEVWVQAGSNLPMYRLATGTLTNLLPAGSAYGHSHVSCRNSDRPGWVYLSDYSTPTTEKGSDQLTAVKLDGSGTVEVFGQAHHQHSGYTLEPQAVPSRDGRRLLFASEWGESGGPVYSYVAGR